MAQPPISLKGRALRYLAGREHSWAELARKLARHEEEPGQIAKVLDDLQAKGFINGERVAASLVYRRGARWGDRRIRQELQAKGLDADTVAEALEPLRGTEPARAHEIWQRKFGAPASDAASRARQMRFLLARGFSMELALRTVEGVEL